MKSFNVIINDFNGGTFEPYDVMPYLVHEYNEAKVKPSSFQELKEFVEQRARYQWWARCEYEILISDWPNKRHTVKWDIHKQVMMNIEIITNILMEEVTNGTTSEEINN